MNDKYTWEQKSKTGIVVNLIIFIGWAAAVTGWTTLFVLRLWAWLG